MERVNLLPDEARLGPWERVVHKLDREFPKLLGISVGVILGLAAVASLAQAVSLHRAKRTLDSLKEEIQTLQVETQNLEAFEKQLGKVEEGLRVQKQFLDRKIVYLEAAGTRARIWATVLRNLRRNIPRGVWLTELETSPGNILRIAGGAGDENLVTEFMANLKASTHFSHVGFNYTEKDVIGNVPVVKFEIVCRTQ